MIKFLTRYLHREEQDVYDRRSRHDAHDKKICNSAYHARSSCEADPVFLFNKLIMQSPYRMVKPFFCTLLLLFNAVFAETIRVQGIDIEVEVAITQEAKTRGLSGRTTLPDNTGMLFVYDKLQICSFWMKDTLIPLSIGFFDGEKRLIEWREMPPPGEKKLTLVTSSKPALYALEMPKGWFAQHKVAPGAELSLRGCL